MMVLLEGGSNRCHGLSQLVLLDIDADKTQRLAGEMPEEIATEISVDLKCMREDVAGP